MGHTHYYIFLLDYKAQNQSNRKMKITKEKEMLCAQDLRTGGGGFESGGGGRRRKGGIASVCSDKYARLLVLRGEQQ